MRPAFALLASVLFLSGCGRQPAPVDPQCAALVEKILKCDPTAPASMRSEPEKHCPTNRLACAQKDVSSPAGCGPFMGCLYDGP
jgi:hypothetical protein